MKSKAVSVIVGIGALALIGWGIVSWRNRGPAVEIEYRYAPVERGELVRSINSPGILEALTRVEVKSKAGGIVTRLVVDEGDFVREGDLIAVIDPRDTQALYDQAAADVDLAASRTDAARRQLELTRVTIDNDIANAQAAVETARVRVRRAEIEANARPALSEASLETARTNLASAIESQNRAEQVTIPQLRQDVTGAVTRTKAELDSAEADYARQQDLLKDGYVAGAVVERARAQLEAARTAHLNAQRRMETLESDIRSLRESERLAVERARAQLREAEANQSQIPVARENLEEARRNLRQAEIALQRAQDAKIQNDVRLQEIRQAEASAVRSRVQLDNARVQLESTTVLAPRDGVITRKFIEEGTIIPPGTSTFAQGTSIVEISDTTTMFVDVAVDEADIAQVREGQSVRVTLEAFRGQPFNGVVERVNPAAQTESNITAIRVRVRVLDASEGKLMPGLNANCEFITMSKEGVLRIPGQAIEREEGKAFVRIKTADPARPETREIEVGEQGNDGVEVISGLSEGDEVVVAEINLAELRDRQRRIEEAEQGGGGLAGGQRPGMGGRSRATTTGGSGGGAGGGGAR